VAVFSSFLEVFRTETAFTRMKLSPEMTNLFVSQSRDFATTKVGSVRVFFSGFTHSPCFGKITMKTFTIIARIFARDYKNYEGVRPIQIYLLRAVFTLTLVFIGKFSWGTILSYEGAWKPVTAVAFCMWAAYSTMSILGIMKPLKMLPIIALQVFYKMVWLCIVAYPLWATGKLAGSDAEQMTSDFMWVILPIVAMPWGYFLSSFFSRRVGVGSQAV
jgi:hypothetical protein